MVCAADLKKTEEEFTPSFVYVGSIFSRHEGGKTHTEADAHAPQFSAAEVAQRQNSVREFLASRTGEMSPQDVAELYRRAGHFSVLHGLVGSGEIDADTSRRIGAARAKLVKMVLADMAGKLKAQGGRLGVNDFGSGEVNAKTDMDMTLYPDSDGVPSAWLTDAFKNTFRRIAGIDPGQMDVVVHRYDATIPDWRQQRGVADFELKMRVGRELLKRNPEAYFLEGAFVQEVMGRSVKEGAKTFRWVNPDGSGQDVHMNAAEVPQFFYRPDVKPRYAWGAAVGNWHFYNAHAGDDAAQAKYLLRSLDEGAALALKADAAFGKLKTTNYADLPERTRRAVVDRLYGHLSESTRNELFLSLEVAGDIRHRKSKGLPIGDAEVLKPFVDYQRRLAIDLPGQDEGVLLSRAKENYQRASQFLLVENIMQSAEPRLTDWLAPRPDDVAQRVVHFVDQNGQLQEAPYTPETQKRLQYAAFFELMDSVELLPPDALQRLKRENPRFRRDIEILEGIVKKRREMMLLPPDVDLPPADALEMRRRAAQSVLDAYAALSKSANGGRLFERVKAGYAFGQAFENWAKSRLGDALVHTSGQRFGPLLDNLRLQTMAVDQELGSSPWLARMTYANSLTAVLTEYVKQGKVNEQVLKTLVLETINYIPVVNVVVDVQRGGGTAVAQIFLVQFVPGYGQVMLAINTAKGLVNLGGAVVFEPLKRDKILLAYQGYLDPQPGGWVLAGVKRRIESPRPHLLYPMDGEGKLSLEQRREAFYLHLKPRIDELVRRRLGFSHPEDKVEAKWWEDAESEFLPQVVSHYVYQWWNAQGPFAQFDELTVKRPMDEYYGEEVRTELARLLIQDYLTGKMRYIEKLQYEPLMDDLARVGGLENSVSDAMQADRARFLASGEGSDLAESGQVTQGLVLDAMPRIDAGITITAAPRVIKVRDDTGHEVERIESYGLRALVSASPDATYPGPFRVSWEMQPLDQGAQAMAQEKSQSEVETAADQVKVTAMLIDGNGVEVQRASLVLPVRKERRVKPATAKAVIKPEPPAVVSEPKPTQQAERVDCGPWRDQYFKRCKQMGDEHIRKNCAPGRLYSGCALDVAGCLTPYVVDALLDDYCAKPGYIGCATGALDAYLGCLQRCNDGLLAGSINTFGITPCRLECQKALDPRIKACKSGLAAPPVTGEERGLSRSPAVGSAASTPASAMQADVPLLADSEAPSERPPVATPAHMPGGQAGLEQDTNRMGQDYRGFDLPSPDPGLCRADCLRETQCKAFTYVKPGHQGPAARCWLKHTAPVPSPNACCVSGVKEAAAQTAVTASFGPLEYGQDRLGLDYTSFNLPAPDPSLCQAACAADDRCRVFTYVKPGHQGVAARCWLKHGLPAGVANACCVSGVKK